MTLIRTVFSTVAISLVLTLCLVDQAMTATCDDARNAYNDGNISESVSILLELAEKNDQDAMLLLGEMHQQGDGVDQNFELAVDWYSRALERGNAEAAFRLGDMAENGNGLTRDNELIAKLYEKAAERNHPAAEFRLSRMYEKGRGVARDHDTSMKLLTRAAHHGNCAAMIEVGELIIMDLNTDKEALGVQWYQQAADQGCPDGMGRLGISYLNGTGVEKDVARARELLIMAAESGDMESQYNLGFQYMHGFNWPKDGDKALYWLEMGANRGDAGSQYQLGMMYYEDELILMDLILAYKWLRLAYDPEGYRIAGEHLRNIEAQLSQSDIDHAELLAREFIPIE